MGQPMQPGGGGGQPPGQSYVPGPGQMIPSSPWGSGPADRRQDASNQRMQETSGRQQAVDEAMMAFQNAQMSGANPMQLAQLQQAAVAAQRGFEQWQQGQYLDEMSRLNQRTDPIGGGRGQSQLEGDPYLAMMLQNQLGMGGGRGSSSGGLNSIGRG